MPTKPTDDVEIWAKAGVFLNGPYAGLDNKAAIPIGVAEEGFIPGSAHPSAAEHVNDWLNRAAQLAHWTFVGSSAGAPDAHIVEADGDGRSRLQGLHLEPTTPGPGLDTCAIYGRTGPGQQYALACDGRDCFGGAGYFVSEVAEALVASGGVNRYAIEARGWFAGGGGLYTLGRGGYSAIVGEADDATAIQGFGGASGNGVYGAAGPAGTHGVWGVGGSGTADGVVGLGGTLGGYGVSGEASDNFWAGVHGATSVGATETVGGVLGVGRGDGAGATFYATGDGWGVVVASFGTRAPVSILPRADDPGVGLDGQLSVRTEGGGNALRLHAGEWRSVHHSRHGLTHLWIPGSDTSTSATAISVPATGFATNNRPRRVGKVIAEWTGEVGRTGTCQLVVDLVDVTAGVVFASRTFTLYQSGVGVYERTELVKAEYTLPAVGARIWRVDITKWGGGGGDVVRVRNNNLEIRGIFD